MWGRGWVWMMPLEDGDGASSAAAAEHPDSLALAF